MQTCIKMNLFKRTIYVFKSCHRTYEASLRSRVRNAVKLPQYSNSRFTDCIQYPVDLMMTVMPLRSTLPSAFSCVLPLFSVSIWSQQNCGFQTVQFLNDSYNFFSQILYLNHLCSCIKIHIEDVRPFWKAVNKHL